jgi:hypothetical protein
LIDRPGRGNINAGNSTNIPWRSSWHLTALGSKIRRNVHRLGNLGQGAVDKQKSSHSHQRNAFFQEEQQEQ